MRHGIKTAGHSTRMKLALAGLLMMGLPLALPLTAAAAAAYPATGVLGQTNYTGGSVNQGGSVSAATLNSPTTIALDSIHHRLFVADSFNGRVLVYLLMPIIT